MTAFGSKELEVLCKQFSEVLDQYSHRAGSDGMADAGVILVQSVLLMKFFKTLVIFLRFKNKIQNLTWPEVYSLYEVGHRKVLVIIDLVLTLPASFAVKERGFSEMKLTKTNVRSRINNVTLNNSMVIQMATPEVKQFDRDPAIHKCDNSSTVTRRPLFKEGGSRKRAILEKHPQAAVEVVEVAGDATASAEPAQKIICEPEKEEQEEDEVQFNDNGENEADLDDEEMVSDYESEPEISEESVLKYLANEL